MGLDVTGGLAKAVGKLPAEFQPVLNSLMDRIAELERQSAKDMDALADKVIAALVPQAQAITQTVNAVADQTLTLLRQVDGATITINLKGNQ